MELLEQISERLGRDKYLKVTVGGTPRSRSQADGIHAEDLSQDAAGATEFVSRFVEAT